jgi:TrmH family RNA methyltransferase
VGSEAHGIAANQPADCDEKLTIPMPGKTESLNAAVAGSIALYLAFGANKLT